MRTSRPSGRTDPPARRERQHADRRRAALEREARQRLARATQTWKRLDGAAQMALVCEIVETRSDELRRAYRGVLAVAAGHSRYRRPGARRKSVDHEPAVTFLVSRKWKTKRPTPRPGDVPARLLAHASVEGLRQLCAVPTDVEDAREYRLSAQAAFPILVTPPPGSPGTAATGA